MARFVDLVGNKFGKLTVIGRAENSKRGRIRWICQCDCGRIKKKPTSTSDLKSGKVRSCGCIYYQSNAGRTKTHGLTSTRLHTIWSGMRRRCKCNVYYRNISVCKEWDSFETFYAWAMQNGYRDDLTIDRIDNTGDYTPDNCRWATYETQENNKSNNRIITYKGEQYTLTLLAKSLGISSATLAWRIDHGWPESDWNIPVNLANRVIRRQKL